ncbi:MAG: hypothetical protein HKL98_06790 [Burkholderiales bacterium]|nr:hypothetical protein [Burkholderiales bacterium]
MKSSLLKAAVLAFSLLGLSACDHSHSPDSLHAAKIPAGKKWTREEFTKLAMGQPDTVIASTFGQPVQDNDYAGPLGIVWTYHGITVNPQTGQPDQFATVVFEHGKVTKVVFK